MCIRDRYFYKNQFGSIKLSAKHNILFAEFKGAVSESVAQYFVKTAPTLIQEFNQQDWGYVSYSEQVEAATPDAHKILIQAGILFYQLGCVKSAYVLKSAIAISQIDKLRKEMGVTDPIQNVLFDTLTEAEQFMRNTLEHANGH